MNKNTPKVGGIFSLYSKDEYIIVSVDDQNKTFKIMAIKGTIILNESYSMNYMLGLNYDYRNHEFKSGDVVTPVKGITVRRSVKRLGIKKYELVNTGEFRVYSVSDSGLELDIPEIMHRDQRTWLASQFELVLNPKADVTVKTVKTDNNAKIAKKNKAKKNYHNRPLFIAASKNGLTHKGIASKLNKRNVNTFGNSVTQALSKYEDRFKRKLDLKEAVVMRLVPYTIRIDKKTGKARLGSEIK